MISLLGDYVYEFPKPFELKLRLKDMLEENVEEKFYLSEKALNGKIKSNFGSNNINSIMGKDGIIPTLMARDYKYPKLVKVAQLDGFESSGRVYSEDGLAPTINTMGGGQREPKIAELIPFGSYYTWKDKQGNINTQCNRACNPENLSLTIPTIAGHTKVVEQNLKTQLCNKLIEEKRVKEFDVIRHSYSNSRIEKMSIQNNTNHDCSPTLDTRCDCLGVVVIDGIYYRIRKLTPKECWRLMGLSDTDFDKAKATGMSNSMLYKQAGNGICVNVLMEIFKNLIGEQNGNRC